MAIKAVTGRRLAVGGAIGALVGVVLGLVDPADADPGARLGLAVLCAALGGVLALRFSDPNE